MATHPGNRSFVAIVLTGLILIFGVVRPAAAQSISFQLKETLPIDAVGYNRLAGVSDMDGDGALDAVIWPKAK